MDATRRDGCHRVPATRGAAHSFAGSGRSRGLVFTHHGRQDASRMIQHVVVFRGTERWKQCLVALIKSQHVEARGGHKSRAAGCSCRVAAHFAVLKASCTAATSRVLHVCCFSKRVTTQSELKIALPWSTFTLCPLVALRSAKGIKRQGRITTHTHNTQQHTHSPTTHRTQRAGARKPDQKPEIWSTSEIRLTCQKIGSCPATVLYRPAPRRLAIAANQSPATFATSALPFASTARVARHGPPQGGHRGQEARP